jgi:hypothetical protein
MVRPYKTDYDRAFDDHPIIVVNYYDVNAKKTNEWPVALAWALREEENRQKLFESMKKRIEKRKEAPKPEPTPEEEFFELFEKLVRKYQWMTEPY